MCQEAIFCDWAKSENSDSSHIGWKRETIFHCGLIPHLENLQNHSKNSSVLAFAAIGT